MTVPRLDWGTDAPLSIPQARKLLLYNADGSPILHLDDASGNVGIGTSSPVNALHIKSDSLVGLVCESTTGTTDEQNFQFLVTSGGILRLRGLTDALGAGVSGIALDLGSGDVGINNTSPGFNLHVLDASATEVRIESTGANSSAGVAVENDARVWTFAVIGGASDNLALIDSTGGTSPLQIEVGASSAALYIDTNDNVGLGTSTPDSKLDIGAGAITGSEMTAPGAPIANGWVMYGEDNGAGKTRVMIKFNTGAAQQIAIQP